MKIKLENVSKSFKNRSDKGMLEVLSDLTFEVQPSEIFSVVGPSGCGKSTIINLIAGFIFPDKGKIAVNGNIVTGPNASRTVVFQDHAVFPWMTVRKNVEFGLKCKNVSETERAQMVSDLLKKVRLEKFANRYPDELSGGMKQRVALARAFAVKPEIILMDEPFASLDQQTRDILQEEFLKLQDEISQTVLLITHNIDEALFLSDRVAVLSNRPARVKEMFVVPFTKPRSPDIRNQPQFIEMRHKIWHSLRQEIT